MLESILLANNLDIITIREMKTTEGHDCKLMEGSYTGWDSTCIGQYLQTILLLMIIISYIRT